MLPLALAPALLLPPTVRAQAFPQPVPRLAVAGAGPLSIGLPADDRADPGAWLPRAMEIPALRMEGGLGPVGLDDLARHDGRFVSASVRETWLQRIAAEGREEGSAYAAAALGAPVGPYQLSLATEVFAEIDLSPDAAELLLFGNAGRTGSPRELTVVGTSLYALATTSLSLARGWSLQGGGSAEELSVGAAGRWVMGNALVVGEGAEGGTSADPLAIDLTFPIIETARNPPLFDAASGIALDVGVSWEGTGGRWSASAVIRDLISTFRWSVAELAYRPGSALFDAERTETDFDKRPFGAEAVPEGLERLVGRLDELRFRPLVLLGVSFRPDARWRILASLDRSAGGGLRDSWGDATALGGEWQATDHLTLGGGLRHSGIRTRLAGGAGISLGRWRVDGALSSAFGSGAREGGLAFSVSRR